MKTRKLLSIILAFAMIMTTFSVTISVSALEYENVVYQKSGEWSLGTWENYLGVNNDGRQGNCHIVQGKKYKIEFDFISANSNSAWCVFDWANVNNATKTSCPGYSSNDRLKWSLIDVFDNGNGADCLGIGSYSANGFCSFPSRNGGHGEYHYVLIWDTVNHNFDITLTYGESANYHTTWSYPAANTVADSDVLKFVNYGVSDSGYSHVKDFTVSEIVDDDTICYRKSGDWTVNGWNNYLSINKDQHSGRMNITTGNKYLIEFDLIAPNSSSSWLIFDWANGSAVSKSNCPGFKSSDGSSGYQQRYSLGEIYDNGSGKDCVSVGAYGGSFDKFVNRNGSNVTYSYSIIWDTVAKTFDITVNYTTTTPETGSIHKTYTYTNNISDGDVWRFCCTHAATVRDFTVYNITEPEPTDTPEPTATPIPEAEVYTIYTAENGWDVGGAKELQNGGLKLAKGYANAAEFTPELEYGKAYEITYDVNGLTVVSGSWKKPFTLTLAAGGQEVTNVLTYRMVGFWRDATTDQGYSPGSNGENKIVIDTISGEWEAYALGNKATYSGFTSTANGATKTYNAFSDVSDLTLKFYALDTSDGFDTPYISNVTVTEIEPSEYGEDDDNPELLNYKIKSNGTVVETPNGLSEFDIELNFKADARKSGDITVLAGVYDENGMLVSAGLTDETIAGLNNSATVSVSLEAPYSSDNTLKVMVWDGDGSLRPLLPVIYPAQSFTLYSIADGAELHNDIMLAYLNDSYENVSEYAWGSFDKDDPKPVSFVWVSNSDNAEYTLEISENSDMSDARVITTNENKCDIYNLKIGTRYYWRVSTDGGKASEVLSFTTCDDAPRCIQAEGLSNGRDVGGWSTADGGRVKQGLVYRSYCFDYVNSNDKTVTLLQEDGIDTLVNEIGIKSEIDLRNESSKISSILGNSVNYYRFGMNYNEDYLSTNKTSIKNVFDTLADSSNYPVIYHCQAGADRTGCITYLLNGLLGVSKEDLFRDYLLTNFAINDYGSRELSNISNRYVKTLDEYENGEGTLAQRIYHYLNNEIGVSTQNLDFIINYLTE